MQIPVSTAARLLRTLEAGRFLRRDEHGHYRPGAQLLQLGTLALDGDPVREFALPHLREMARTTMESAYLGVHDQGDSVLYLAQAASLHAIRHSLWAAGSVVAAFNIVGPTFRLDDDTLASTGVPTLSMPGPCRHSCAA